MPVLPISNIINVSITDTPQGLTERNVNSLALFTTELPNNSDEFGIYISPAQVTADYGTNSVTAAMANAAFAQAPNLRSGNGRLVIIPFGHDNSAVATASATPGHVTTANLSANLANIILVATGDIKVTVNGVAYNLTNLNFTGCVTWADVAAVIQAKLLEGIVTAESNGFTITSKKVGTASTVAMAAVSGGFGTNLAASGYFNVGAESAVPGANAVGETLLAAIARTSGLVSYTPIMTNLEVEDAVILATSDAIEAMDNIYFESSASTQDIAGIATEIQAAGNKKTRFLLYTPSNPEANLMKAAYAGRGLSTNFSGNSTAGTMELKGLTTIDPDLGLTQTLYNACEIAGVDTYGSIAGVAGVNSTGGNDYFDNVYMDLALKFALEVAGFNFLRQTSTKIAQTEQGMSGLKNAYIQAITQFIANGCIAPGTWTSSETFGNPETFLQNITINGYYVYSLPIALQAAMERENRQAPLVQIAIKRAGAIQSSNVLVIIND